ncbi:MAG: chorismate-binding protein [Thermoplasmatota archaeon]
MGTSRLERHEGEAAWLEPLDAFERCDAAGWQPLLLGAGGAHPDARYSFLALTSVQEERFEAGDADPVGRLRRLAASMHVPGEEPAPFTGGLVGYFAYEFARHLDDRARTHAPDGPDAVLRLCLDAVVFDHHAGTVRLFCNDLEGHPAPEPAEARLAALAKLLTGPAQEPTADPTSGGAPVQWATSLDQAAFEASVRRLKGLIDEGDLFQANIATRHAAPLQAQPARLFGHLLTANPSPYMALLPLGDHTLVSGSPELLVRVQEGIVSSRPIAGTRRRGTTPQEDAALEAELVADEKEQAEHTMLVDLLRNDVARVAIPGTVTVPEFASIERYRHVMHLVSRVEGQLRPGTDLAHWLTALFPGGTITGAPKLRAMQRIAEAEPVPRGAYTGSAGYLSWSHNACWNILIRTLVLRSGEAQVAAGSGIVADSVPEREWREAGHKARALLQAASGQDQGPDPGRLGDVTPQGDWAPPRADPDAAIAARVLLVDNEDSFVYNLADYAAALGAHVHVIRNTDDWRAALAAHEATHVILSPGPGRPAEAGCSIEMARELAGRLPMLGVCLGEQAMAVAHGGRAEVADVAVHGKWSLAAFETGQGLFEGLEAEQRVGRYHSLVVPEDGVPDGFGITARLADGTVMAIEDPVRRQVGLQFHPESLSTPLGLEILRRFLESP